MNRSTCRAMGLFCMLGFLIPCGCATVTRGNKQIVKLVTDPPAAHVVVDGHPYITPADVVIRRKKEHEVLVEKPGYQGVLFKLKSHWDGGGVGAVAVDAAVPGGSALFVIDWLWGADREFSKLVTIKLPPATQPSPPVTLYEYKGKLLSKEQFDAAVEHDRIFKTKKKGAATQPASTQPKNP